MMPLLVSPLQQEHSNLVVFQVQAKRVQNVWAQCAVGTWKYTPVTLCGKLYDLAGLAKCGFICDLAPLEKDEVDDILAPDSPIQKQGFKTVD